MKYLFAFSLSILSCLFLTSCSENNEIIDGNRIKSVNNFSFDQSISAWKNLKKTQGTSYNYTTETVSWTGFGTSTTIKIKNNSIVSRTYKEFNRDGDAVTITDSYTENTSQLGTHTKGAPLYTIDELYDSCISDYLNVSSTTNTLVFETTKNGILTHCGYTPKNCADDCYNGFSIRTFSWTTND